MTKPTINDLEAAAMADYLANASEYVGRPWDMEQELTELLGRKIPAVHAMCAIFFNLDPRERCFMDEDEFVHRFFDVKDLPL